MKRILLVLLIVQLFSGVYAQDVEFTAEAPRVLRVGEQFQLTYTINNKPDEFELPQLQDFQLLGGPSQQHSSSTQIINGKVTKSSYYIYSYYYRALKEGKFTIQPATIAIKRNTYQSNALSVEVVSGSASSATPGNSNNSQSGNQEGMPSDEDIFVRLVLDKKSAYIGEQVSGWIKLYTKVQVSDYDRQFKGPDYTGFFKQDVEIPQLRTLERENINGEIYNTGVLRRVILTPQKSGEITIEPFDLVVAVQQQTKQRSRSIFDEFFDSPFRTSQITLQSAPVKIRIEPLPKNGPSSFTGAVGKFLMNASISSGNLKTNDAITLKVEISGTGNLSLIDKLNITFPPALEVFDPAVKSNISHKSGGSSGSKTFEYTLIARHPGDFVIPSIKFSFFDPSSEIYRTISSQDFNLHIEKSDQDTSNVIVTGLSKEEYKLLESDIRFIENNSVTFIKKGHYLIDSIEFYLFYIITFVLFLIIVVMQRERIKRNANVILKRNRKANQFARKRLRKASMLMKQKKHEQFYEEVMKALQGYLSDKLIIPVSELSKEFAKEKLIQNKVDEDIINGFFTVIDSCEFARFAPRGQSASPEEIYKSAMTMITKLEQKIR